MNDEPQMRSVLILDDEVANTLQEAFEKGSRRTRFAVTTACTLEDLSVEIAQGKHFDVGIIDMWVPLARERNELITNAGFLVVVALAVREFNPFGLLIVYTGHYSDQDLKESMRHEVLKECFRQGADDYLDKNRCSALELVERVEELLRERDEKQRLEEHIHFELLPAHAEWLLQYTGRHVAILSDQIIADGAHRLDVMLKVWKQDPSAKPFILCIG